MGLLDWATLSITLMGLIAYGIYKSRHYHTLDPQEAHTYQPSWYLIGFSVMATQASAVTFISLPGLAFQEGTKFIQTYFGLPLAMLVLAIFFVPKYQRQHVATAYQFLENRFDRRVRMLISLLFLTQRGVATAIGMYAPAVVLSAIFGWNTLTTNTIVGIIIVLLTWFGGTRALSYTHMFQMFGILALLTYIDFFIFSNLPEEVGWQGTLKLSEGLGKLQSIDLNFDLKNKYNIYSGLIGGFFIHGLLRYRPKPSKQIHPRKVCKTEHARSFF